MIWLPVIDRISFQKSGSIIFELGTLVRIRLNKFKMVYNFRVAFWHKPPLSINEKEKSNKEANKF